jgi:hypothetical protein
MISSKNKLRSPVKIQKKWLMAYSIVVLIFIAGCEKNLFEEVPYIGNIKTSEDIRIIIDGSYALLNSDYYWRNYWLVVSRGDDQSQSTGYFGGGCDDPDELHPFEYKCKYVVQDLDISSTTYDSKYIYSALYKSIINLNKIICFFEPDKATNEIKPLLGEAYLMRGYFYFLLTRFYGRIPLVVDTDVNYKLNLPGTDEIYEHITSDLQIAMSLLPETNMEGSTSGNLNQGSAKALLAEVYLTMGGYPLYDTAKYALAAQLSGEVIENKEIYCFELLADYKELLKYQLNNEYLISINFEQINNVANDYKVFPEWAYYNAYPYSYRKKAVMNTSLSYYKEFMIDDELVTMNIVRDVNNVSYEEGPGFIYVNLKYKKFQIQDYNLNGPTKDDYVEIGLLRYARTLLTFAESKARIGELDNKAYEALNEVRRRAHFLDIYEPSDVDLQQDLTKGQFIDSVIAERAWEFCVEPEGRWFDIIRLNALESIKTNRHELEPEIVPLEKIFPDGGYFAAIPEEDQALNQNLE